MFIQQSSAYAGIGARNTPETVLKEMKSISKYLSPFITLRSGGAKGADSAFEHGCFGQKEIFYTNKCFFIDQYILYTKLQWETAYNIAASLHPYWNHLPEYAQKLHTRNCFQLLGLGLNCDTYSKFVICWTMDGVTKGSDTTRASGGTGQSIRVASYFNIPVFNLNNQDSTKLFYDMLNTMEKQ